MTWLVAAGVVALVHVGYLVFQTLGALLGLRWRRWLWAHAAAVTWGVLIVVTQGRCPLTRLEKELLARSGGPSYTESFLDHYLFGRVLPDGSQAWVYGLHLVVIAATYAVVAVHWHRQQDAVAAGGAAGGPEGSLP
jgi:hypothetical protein